MFSAVAAIVTPPFATTINLEKGVLQPPCFTLVGLYRICLCFKPSKNPAYILVYKYALLNNMLGKSRG
jgi:hypothetical protein